MSSEASIINTIYPATGLKWSKPVYRAGNKVLADGKGLSMWSWDASGDNNQAVGGKTAEQVCQALGAGWRLPHPSEVDADYFKSLNYANYMLMSGYSRWSSQWNGGAVVTISVQGSTGYYTSPINNRLAINCVKQ